MTKKSPVRKPKSVDFEDQDAVKKAMAKELDIDVDELEIEEAKNLASFRTGGTFYCLTSGRQEYFVAENEESAHELTVAMVKQDLDDSPENFEPNFIESHINVDRLRRDLSSDVQSNIYDNLHDEAERRPMEFLKENGLDIPEPTAKQIEDYANVMSDDDKPAAEIISELKGMNDAEDRWIEMGEEPEVADRLVESIAETQAEEQLKDPIQYLRDMMGDEEGVKKAIEMGGIDVDAAAEEAVSVDGPGHFLSGYDGNLKDGPGKMVYWRHN